MVVLLLFFGVRTSDTGLFESLELTTFEVRQDKNSVSSNQFAMAAIFYSHEVIQLVNVVNDLAELSKFALGFDGVVHVDGGQHCGLPVLFTILSKSE